MTGLPGAATSDAGGVSKFIKSLEPRMTEFTLSRATIRYATNWRYHRVRTLIENPYDSKGGSPTRDRRVEDGRNISACPTFSRASAQTAHTTNTP